MSGAARVKSIADITMMKLEQLVNSTLQQLTLK
jgi:hypothetical protein